MQTPGNENMSIRSKFLLPKEHGAWAMLYVPFILGVIVARALNLPVLLLLLSVTAFFISRESLLIWWRARTRGKESTHAGRLLIFYIAISSLSGAPLILVYGMKMLVPMAAAGIILLVLNGRQATQFEDRKLSNELLVIVGLTMTAPAAYYAATGALDATAFWLWGLSALYFASSVFYVRLRIVSINPRKEDLKRRIRINCLLYHSFLVIGLVVLLATHRLPYFALIAFLPILARTYWNLLKPSRQVNLTRAGVLEIIYSLIFLLFISISFNNA